MKKIVTFGEVMLRISPLNQEERINQTNIFKMEPGGSEANVAVALANLGLETAFISKLPRNGLSKIIISSLKKNNVEVDNLIFDERRLGIYFTETGVGQRASHVIYDRTSSSFSKVSFNDFNWDKILKEAGWFHTSGITPAISQNTTDCLLRVLKKTNSRIMVSIDLNYRNKLWSWLKKDPKKTAKIMQDVCSRADLILANESDFQNVFAFDGGWKPLLVAIEAFRMFYKLKVIGISLRNSISASHNKWSGKLFVKQGKNIKEFTSYEYDINPIVDRIGTGDSFSAGIIYGLMKYRDNYQKIVNFAAALSCLNHSVRGDFSPFTKEDVVDVMKTKGSGTIIR